MSPDFRPRRRPQHRPLRKPAHPGEAQRAMLQSAQQFALGRGAGGSAGQRGADSGGLLQRVAPSDWFIALAVLLTTLFVIGLGALLRLGPGGPAPAPRAVPTPERAPSGAVLAAIASPLPSPIATPTAAAGYVVETGGPAARLRAGPGLGSAIVERLPNGSQVTEIGLESSEGGRTWRQVRGPSGSSGWIEGSLLRRAPGPAPNATAPGPGPAR